MRVTLRNVWPFGALTLNAHFKTYWLLNANYLDVTVECYMLQATEDAIPAATPCDMPYMT